LNVSVEVTSVNNRFLEYSFGYRSSFFPGAAHQELIAARLNRGKINLTLNYEDNESASTPGDKQNAGDELIRN